MQTAVTVPTGGRVAAVLAVLRRRWPSMLATGVAAALWGVDTVTAAQLLPVLPLLHLVLVVIRRPEASWPALLVSVAAVALLVAPDVARWVLAAGWLGHGAWDLVHLRRREVVSRSYAEWCATLDVLFALQLVLVR